ncbi:MAG: methylenetetrahydrofolate reductase [Nanoarchaeota archaeon]|nr:methylenetetrahydrofolate reductase [Nanoarchaeota archaeon]
MKITEMIKNKGFTRSVELVPPRNGTDPAEIFSKVALIKDKVDFVSVTDGAGGSLRGGTLAISHLVQENYGIKSMAHFVCRERTKEQIENNLVDMHYFGVKNVLALRGDAPAGSAEGWIGEYEYAYKLVKQISNMNKGIYLPRKGQDVLHREGVKTDFCISVAGHPEDPIQSEVSHLKAKIEAGATCIITQMIFSFDEYKNYVEGLRQNGIDLPVIAGIRPLTTLKQAESVENFFGIKICSELKTGLEKEGFGLQYAKDALSAVKKVNELIQ